MITFHSLLEFVLPLKSKISKWIEFTIHQEGRELGEIAYVFCTDEYLLEKNIKYLKHNTLTDIISFDYCIGDLISGDIFISIERVIENANHLNITFENEIHRIMIHGILHFCGYKDKNTKDRNTMRSKEDYYLSLRTF
jgi:rRNA maturation RNase YbeY